MSDTTIPPLSLVQHVFDPLFNALVVEAILYGVYTVIYCQVIWNLRKQRDKRLYTFTLIVLWIVTTVTSAIDWMTERNDFVFGTGSLTAMIETFTTQASPYYDIPYILQPLVSDIVIVWRCDLLWRNKWIRAFFIIMFTGYLVLSFLNVAYGATDTLEESLNLARMLLSLATTLSATFLIAFKIAIVTWKSPMRRSYAKVVEVLVESAALISVVLLFDSILVAVSIRHPWILSTESGMALYQIHTYLNYVQRPLIGLAPTLIAFRVAKEPTRTHVAATTISRRLSRLTFRRSRHPTNTGDTQIYAPGIGSTHQPEIISIPQPTLDIEAQGNATIRWGDTHDQVNDPTTEKNNTTS